MLIAPSDMTQEVTVITRGEDTKLFVFTECPANEDGATQVRNCLLCLILCQPQGSLVSDIYFSFAKGEEHWFMV